MAHTELGTHPVVVGVDESDSARDAALWAADLAALWTTPLHLITVLNRPGTLTPDTPPWLRELAAAAERAGATQTTTEVRFGSVTDQLLAGCLNARLVVLGSYGGEGWSGMLAGSTALPLIARCGCPLIVVRGHEPGISPPRDGPVVVGVDNTPTAAKALRFAADLANRSEHRHLIAVHTWSDIEHTPHGPTRTPTDDPTTLARQATQILQRQLAPVIAAHPQLAIERHVNPDTPLRALLDHAPKAWLLVVGQRAIRQHGAPLFGSTSLGLVEFARCPVAVIPPHDETTPTQDT